MEIFPCGIRATATTLSASSSVFSTGARLHGDDATLSSALDSDLCEAYARSGAASVNRLRERGASRTRTGDLLGAITPSSSDMRPVALVQAIRGAVSSVRFSQFGSTVGSAAKDALQAAPRPR